MNLSQLRKLIREEVEGTLDEADKAKKTQPKTFQDFRKMMGAAMAKAGAPPILCDEIKDMNQEGEGVADALFRAWKNLDSEIKDAGKDIDAEWPHLVEYYVHDCVLDVCDAFNDSMNYSPGTKSRMPSPQKLAVATVAAVLGSTSNTKVGTLPGLLDVANIVIDVLEASGAADDVSWDGKSPKVTFKVTRSDYHEMIFDVATRGSGFEPVIKSEDEIPDTYKDEETGLKIHFGDGVATISK